jgi:hypothetical protein
MHVDLRHVDLRVDLRIPVCSLENRRRVDVESAYVA